MIRFDPSSTDAVPAFPVGLLWGGLAGKHDWIWIADRFGPARHSCARGKPVAGCRCKCSTGGMTRGKRWLV